MFVCDVASQDGAHESGRGVPRRAAESPKIEFRSRHRSKDGLSLIRRRFWIDMAIEAQEYQIVQTPPLRLL